MGCRGEAGRPGFRLGRCLVMAYSRSRTLFEFWSGREEVGEEICGEGEGSASSWRGVEDGVEVGGELNPGLEASTVAYK